MIDGEKLKKQLGKFDVAVVVKPTTGSTNTDGKELFRSSLSSAVLIAADEQTGGRGRQGKTFLSPVGGLYMTLVLPLAAPIGDAVMATSCSAVAVSRALERYGVDCGIKWVNDIYAVGKKLCGILVEAENDYRTMTTHALIIGIGVNVESSPSLDGDVKAVSLRELGCSADITDICASIAEEMLVLYNDGFDFSSYRDEYVRRSIVLGREITFTENGVIRSGKALDIGDRGELIVDCGDKTVALTSGEISVRTV